MPTLSQRTTDLLIKGLLILFLFTIALPVRMINYTIRLCSKRHRKVSPFFYALFIAGHFTVAGQSFTRFAGSHQMGLESTFGIKSFDIKSNIAEINTLHVQLEGGTVGVVFGAKSLVVKFRQGFYYSSASVAQTIDEVKSEVQLNFYPTYFLKDVRLRPYLIVEVERDVFRMHGFYGGDDKIKVNHSLSEDPYLGNISTIQAGVGAGLEHRIKSQTHFVAFFGEAKYCQPVRTISSNQLFAETKLSNQLLLSVGISFGYYRYEIRRNL